jgi:hypothetical protein
MKIPEDLKLQPPEWPNVSELAREVANLIQDEAAPTAISGTRTVERLPDNVVKALLAMATNAWRIRVRLTDSTSGEPRDEVGKDELKKLNRYVEAIFESLGGIGMKVKDRTGEAFDYGLPEKVVTAHQQPGLTKEMIIETLRPTIYWGSQIAQQGEVVIGTPPAMPEDKER